MRINWSKKDSIFKVGDKVKTSSLFLTPETYGYNINSIYEVTKFEFYKDDNGKQHQLLSIKGSEDKHKISSLFFRYEN